VYAIKVLESCASLCAFELFADDKDHIPHEKWA